MQIQNSGEFASAVLRLKGNTSYSKLSRKLSHASEGFLDVDTVWLQRLSTAYVASVRSLTSADLAVTFGLSLMLNALEDGQCPERILEDGRVVLVNLLGPKTAQLAYAEISEQLQAITHPATMIRFLKTCIQQWLPEVGSALLPGRR